MQKAVAVALMALCPLMLARGMGPYRLDLEAPIDRWDEAIPLGNGLTGGLLWGSGNELRLSLDRGDLWDLRKHAAYSRPGFSYSTVVDLATTGRTEELNREYSRVSDVPTKLPGGRLVLTLDPRLKAQSFHLDLKQGMGIVQFSKQRAECFFSATEPVAIMFIPGPAPKLQLAPNAAVQSIGLDPASVHTDSQSTWLVQEGSLGFRYVILAAASPMKDGILVVIAITTNRDAADPLAVARQRVSNAIKLGYSKMLEAHIRWWAGFWAHSSVVIPDERILQHYNLAQYFYGAASRLGAPPMPLQGVWTADDGRLPPWHGDYHHDLNTQLTYWAYLTSGHFDEGRTFLDFMWGLRPRHEEFARTFFRLRKGLVVPGVMGLDGSAMGSWFQYTLSPTMGAWVAQSFYLHWRYEMDRTFLAQRAYPYCAGVADALVELLKPDPSGGHIKLPLSSSPEIHNNTQRAWLKPNSNFDLALLMWLFDANTEMAAALGKTEDVKNWRACRSRLDPLVVAGESGSLQVAPGEPLWESHRHHSQLVAIHPLGLLNIEGAERDRRIIDASFAEVDSLGTSLWCGYSFSWMAAMRARASRGAEALSFLSKFVESFVLRNGFHANGEQTRKGLSNFHYRPFTLEGNFAAAQAVHEMLLQSWGGRIRIFPAMPPPWRDVSFRNLRAEGGFSISAERRDGRTTSVSIAATVKQALRLKNPFEGRPFDHNLPIEEHGDEILCLLAAGRTLELKEAAHCPQETRPDPGSSSR